MGLGQRAQPSRVREANKFDSRWQRHRKRELDSYSTLSGSGMVADLIPWALPTAIQFNRFGVVTNGIHL